jgi:hypothetical protein
MEDSADRITIAVPGRLNDWFMQRPPTLSVKHLPVVHEYPDRQQQLRIWEDFLTKWEAKEGALYRFNPEYPKLISGSPFDLEKMIREDTDTPADRWVLNCLPDTWIRLSEEVVTELAGGGAKRHRVHEMLIDRMCMIYRRDKRKERLRDRERKAAENFDRLIEREELRIIRISAAQSRPRFLGERIWNPQMMADLLTHTALALARSQPCIKKDDFKNGWLLEMEDQDKPH